MPRRNNLPGEWVRVAKKHRDRVPAGSGFGAYKDAMQRASAEYHGGRSLESNPSHVDLVKVAIIGAAIYFGALIFRKGQ